MASRRSRHSKTFITVPSYPGDQSDDSDEVNQHESIVNHSFAVNDIKHTDEQEEFALETEILSSYFELPRPPKNAHAHAQLATPKTTRVKLPTPKLNNIKLGEQKSHNPPSSFTPPRAQQTFKTWSRTFFQTR
jgi:hypothetical protein